MTIKRFDEIEAWQLAKAIYRESRHLPMRREWRYCSQIQSGKTTKKLMMS